MKIIKTNGTADSLDKTNLFNSSKINDERMHAFLNDEISGGEIGRKLFNRSIDVSMIRRKNSAITSQFVELTKRR
jgi:hypothetical protein